MGKIKKTQEVLIKDLKLYENNAKIHPERQIEKLCDSINEYGFINPCIIDDNNNVIAGHGRIEAAKQLGWEKVPCLFVEGLTEAQRKGYILADNKLSELAEWDTDLVSQELESLDDLDFNIELTGFSFDDINVEIGPITEDDDYEIEPPKEPKAKLGDIYLLGNHRLMCGDATNDNSVDLLMNGKKADMVFTDPPYNTGMSEMTSGNRKAWLCDFFDDVFTDDEWQTFMSKFTAQYDRIMKNDTVAYICLDWRRNHELVPHIKKHFELTNVIIWDKVVHGLGRDYKYTYEIINVCKKGKITLDTHQGDREYQDVWHIQRKIGRDEDHATKKPIEVSARAIRHGSKENDIVVDLFGGSGTTLLACEQLNRSCYMMELEPKYVDVIINRWEQFTDKKAVLLNG